MSGGKSLVSDLSWTVTLTATNAHLQGKAKSKKKKKKTESSFNRTPRQEEYTSEVPPVPRAQAVPSPTSSPHRAPLLTNYFPPKWLHKKGCLPHWLICSYIHTLKSLT